ncbi:SLOG cluster 4 domain-containing protein [Actinoplanes subglobosus]|uniref:LOG family protein n=1 Tax=Actinoplanes subglobosus TaxID=1547892 RepID=A0ABV8ISL9_9ACTN
MEPDSPGPVVRSLATQLRQALQGCAQHPAGPLAAFDRCHDALAAGDLTPAEFRAVGELLADHSRERMAADGATPATVLREQRMARFVTALFGIGSAPPVLPRVLIGVVGKGRDCPEQVIGLGHRIGELIGRRRDRLALVTGGLGGVMEAAAKGAKEHGGLVISVLPAAAHRPSRTHGHADLSIDTGLTVHSRNVVLASTADALVAAPGAHGTLQEMLVASDLGKPVWAVGDHAVRLPGVDYLPGLDAVESKLDGLFTQVGTDLQDD